MRHAFVILLVALAVPAAALATPRDKGDGTLAVKNAKGMIVVSGKGTIIGRVESGVVTIVDTKPFDTVSPEVFGYDSVSFDGNAATYGCQTQRCDSLRFRFVGAAFRVTAVGRGIDLSAVGQGRARLLGSDGLYALDGAPFQSLPLVTPLVGTFGGTATVGG